MTARDRTDPWEARFKELREYRITHGDFARSTRRAGALGTWVTNHHAAYRSVRREGRKSFLRLPQDLAPTERLEGIDFFCGGRRRASPTLQRNASMLSRRARRRMDRAASKGNSSDPVGMVKWVSVKRKEY